MCGVWRWAWAEARRRRGEFWLAGAVFAMATVVAGVLLAGQLPAQPPPNGWQKIVVGIEAAGLGVVAVFLLSLVLALVVAPIQQRNALRESVRQHQAQRPPRDDPDAVGHRDRLVAAARGIGFQSTTAENWHWQNAEYFEHLCAHLGDAQSWLGQAGAALAASDRAATERASVVERFQAMVRAVKPSDTPEMHSSDARLILYAHLYSGGNAVGLAPHLISIVKSEDVREAASGVRDLDDEARKQWVRSAQGKPPADELRDLLRATECQACRR